MIIKKLNSLEKFILNVSKEINDLHPDDVDQLLAEFSSVNNMLRNKIGRSRAMIFLNSISNLFRTHGKLGISSELNETKSVELITIINQCYNELSLAEKMLFVLLIPVWFNDKTAKGLSLSLERLNNEKAEDNLFDLDFGGHVLSLDRMVESECIKAIYNTLCLDDKNPFIRHISCSLNANYEGYHPRTTLGLYHFVMADHLETYLSVMINGLFNDVKIPLLKLVNDYKVILPLALSFHGTMGDKALNSYLDAQDISELNKSRIKTVVSTLVNRLSSVDIVNIVSVNNINFSADLVNTLPYYVLNHAQLNRILKMDFNLLSNMIPQICDRLHLWNSNKVVQLNDCFYIPSKIYGKVNAEPFGLFKEGLKTPYLTMNNKKNMLILPLELNKKIIFDVYNKYMVSEIYKHPMTKEIIEVRSDQDMEAFYNEILKINMDCLRRITYSIDRVTHLFNLSDVNMLFDVNIEYDRINNELILFKIVDKEFKYATGAWKYYDKININGSIYDSVIVLRLSLKDAILKLIDCTYLVNHSDINLVDLDESMRMMNDAISKIDIGLPTICHCHHDKSNKVNQNHLFQIIKFLANTEQMTIHDFIDRLNLNHQITVVGLDSDKLALKNEVESIEPVCHSIINYLFGGNKLTKLTLMDIPRDVRRSVNNIIASKRTNDILNVLKGHCITDNMSFNEDKLSFLNAVVRSQFKEVKNYYLTILREVISKQSVWSNSYNTQIKAHLVADDLNEEDILTALTCIIPLDTLKLMTNDEIKDMIKQVFMVDIDLDDFDVSNFQPEREIVRSFPGGINNMIESIRSIIIMFMNMWDIDFEREDFKAIDIIKLMM